MRIWDYRLLPYLPDAQFKGQLRELVAIMHDWRNKGKTNHLLINKIMEYPKSDLWIYFIKYNGEYKRRYGNLIKNEIYQEFASFPEELCDFRNPFPDWHNKEYLRVCMANLYEKHIFGIGKSRITDEEWARLCEGYKKITGEKYAI
jgi:uncharacterized protein (TIGR02328 family)